MYYSGVLTASGQGISIYYETIVDMGNPGEKKSEGGLPFH
jgi:hypothetical protein